MQYIPQVIWPFSLGDFPIFSNPTRDQEHPTLGSRLFQHDSFHRLRDLFGCRTSSPGRTTHGSIVWIHCGGWSWFGEWSQSLSYLCINDILVVIVIVCCTCDYNDIYIYNYIIYIYIRIDTYSCFRYNSSKSSVLVLNCLTIPRPKKTTPLLQSQLGENVQSIIIQYRKIRQPNSP